MVLIERVSLHQEQPLGVPSYIIHYSTVKLIKDSPRKKTLSTKDILKDPVLHTELEVIRSEEDNLSTRGWFQCVLYSEVSR